VATYAWTASWVAVFAVGTVLNLTGEVADPAWMRFWRTYTLIMLAVSIAVIVWFSAGGVKNLKDMIASLKVMKRDHADTGFVEKDRG
jgi:hypothetical protein